MKLKTKQAIAKRFMVTKKGKVLKRKAGQAHFNGREPGKVTRMKRRDIPFASRYTRTVKNALQS